MRRLVSGAVVGAGLLVSAASCDDPAPFAPSMDRVVALRADGATVQAWTGRPCEGVTRVVWVFDADGSSPVRQVLDAPRPTTVERLDSSRAPDGFRVTEALPADFDWRRFERVEVLLDTTGGAFGGEGPLVPLGESARHPGASFVDDEGWLDDAEVRAGDGEDFLGACTPDPAD